MTRRVTTSGRWTEGIPAAIPMHPRTCECDDDECGGTCAGSRPMTACPVVDGPCPGDANGVLCARPCMPDGTP